ncbi:hypothetical protein ACN23B_02380 [Anabaena sp. FACHB-709]|uniref:WD-40 repeat protein n=2 Tax=Nostocaceae TaxID=1162 RepID=A0A1Z4KR71_ANAVA|nr:MULTISPECIES: hypothetical protein [Nostocaceae]BAY71448.1 WD-40 repeat protein [Trichormus variabilis NIES-23]HBW32538.1 hypothetical protein [Nostoc sp. UBA8866]MBD2172127.1 hypothetical protein [Anabaena cylindrica FACHB-318]MBD2263683.1 hypothetical protein [Anabaena sp. FACHB-709]MBD2274731.1 hypothetical protein [Nostoc sp. PCC 7120 = FACHB-418]
MVEGHPPVDIKVANERAFTSLWRAIALSHGSFSVALVYCNYRVLQEKILQRLDEISVENPIQKVVLPPNTRSLYTTLHLNSLPQQQQPSALMVLGLESVEEIDDLLRAINHIRDEFPKRHSFPMIFWVNEEVLQKVIRLAPDFASWAATPIRFEMTTPELLQFLRQETDSLFARVLPKDIGQHQQPQFGDDYSTLEQVWEHSNELHYAIAELHERGITLEPELNASLKFVFGLDDYVSDRIHHALNHFQQSLQIWQRLGIGEPGLGTGERGISFPVRPTPLSSPILRQGVLQLYIGLCYCRLAEQNQLDNRRHWETAKFYFQECLEILQVAGRPDIASEFIGQLAEVLEHLQAWDELQIVAEKALELHHTYGSQIQLACDYGFLAQVALQQSRWVQASILAHVSLLKLTEAQNHNDSDRHHCLFPLLLAQIYYLVLAKAQQNLGEQLVAQEYLDKAAKELPAALENSAHQYDAHRYIRMLRTLRSLYFEAGRYLEAYRIRQKRRSVEQQYGFRAFIGAGRLQPQRQATNPALMSPSGSSSVALEIAASGREQDINNLIGRISRADQKLIVIHGPSGVGKSSTVTAGLVPALQNRAIGDQIAMPVVLQVYTDWVRELGKALTEAVTHISGDVSIAPEILSTPTPPMDIGYARPMAIADILGQLRQNANNHLITVLIFDQFEEFFFGYSDRQQKKEFDQFLSQCLNISFVKIILSIREDYLHRLLEFKHLSYLEAINNNILDKQIRYQLNNFSPEYAKVIIQKLTARSQVNLEPALIDAVVEDLSTELGEVRPIELQVVGAQIQDERINTLKQYQQYRPNKLIERYIKELIKECGPENERAALLVLYLLTDESNKRPFKTRAELATELAELEDPEKLDLVLDILVNSGLVVLFPDIPERYQLIHDYLVDLIRYLQQQESSLQAQLDQLRRKVQQSQSEIARLKSELSQKKQSKLTDTHPQQGLDLVTELRELRKREELTQLEIEQLRGELKEKELTAQLAESQKQQRLSEAKLNRSLKIALTASCLAILGLSVSIITAVDSEIKTLSVSSEALFASQKGLDAVKEGVKAARKLQRAIWVDPYTREQVQTALYQAVVGVREYNRLEGHTAGVNSAVFSPDGSLIASASADNTINLWRSDGSLINTLSKHTNVVNSVNFSPDALLIASASQDKTVKLWNRVGQLVTTLQGHGDVVNNASFSPDGSLIASGSSDKTVKLWSREGKLLNTLSGHNDAVLGIAWTPDGQTLASVGADKNIKLWNRDGKLLKTWQGHDDAILGVAWSPKGETIATASFDQTIKLWNRQGNLLKTLSGHTAGVTAVTFSPNGETIGSASIDATLKLWSPQGLLLGTLKGHNSWVNSVSFSPDGRIFASGSRDKTVTLWRWDEVLLRNPKGDGNDWVTSISFSSDGETLAAASRDQTVKILSRHGKLLNTFKGHTGSIWGVAWSPNRQMIASASKDQTVKLWHQDGKILHTLQGHQDAVLAVAWSSDSQVIASAGKDKIVKIWSQGGQLLHTLQGHTDAVNWVSFSPDGKLLASVSDDTTVKLWSRDGQLLHTLKEHSRRVNGVAWSPDGQILASASIDGTVKLWNRDGSLSRNLPGDGDSFISVSFSPDGKMLAANSDDQIRLWNQKGTLLMVLKGDKDELTSVTFSPDSQILAVGGGNGKVIFLNLAEIKLENLLVRGCNLLQDYLKTNLDVAKSDRTLCPDTSNR